MTTAQCPENIAKQKLAANPWTFVPLLYFLQAIPVSLIQDVATIVYKDFGIANEPITRWTSIIALPWSLQLLMGPLVDLSSTRRAWVMRCQAVITAALMVVPFVIRSPFAFEMSLAAFLVAAIFSALCNAAMDGFYLMAMPKESQAKFAGVQTTCYRLGGLFAKGLLVFLAGKLMHFEPIQISASNQRFYFASPSKHESGPISIKVTSGALTDEDGVEFAPSIAVPPTVKSLQIAADGTVSSADQVVGRLKLDKGASVTPATTTAPLSRKDAWALILLAGAVLYGLMYLVERRTTPRPVEDVEAPDDPVEVRRNIMRTLAAAGLGLSGYFFANAVVRLGAFAIWATQDGSATGPLKGWMLKDDQTLLTFAVHGPGWLAECVQLLLAGVAFAFLLVSAKRSIVGTPMGDAFASYFRQSGIVAILLFLIFYRFGEAMVAKISPLFLKDSLSNGGLGIPTETVGQIKGVVGVFGIVLGGLAGGWVVSRFGLKRSFWPIAVCMHLPNLLYLWASINKPPLVAIYGVDFIEQFGYGFGFAGYMIFQMHVAQRGKYRTAHYALGVGIGALFIQIAGVLSGVLQANMGYPGMFGTAVILAIPGLLTLFFIPLDEPKTAPKTI